MKLYIDRALLYSLVTVGADCIKLHREFIPGDVTFLVPPPVAQELRWPGDDTDLVGAVERGEFGDEEWLTETNGGHNVD